MNTQNELNRKLIVAAAEGETEKVKALIAAGVDVNAKNCFGTTALMDAAELGHVEVVRALLAAGADANAMNRGDGKTALMLAAQFGRIEVVQALLAAGADVNARKKVGGKALCSAVGLRVRWAIVEPLEQLPVWFMVMVVFAAYCVARSWGLWTLLWTFGVLCAVWVRFVIWFVLFEAARHETALMLAAKMKLMWAAKMKHEEVMRALIAGGAHAVWDATVLRLNGWREAAAIIAAARKRAAKSKAGRD